MQQYNVIATTTVRPRQRQESLCKTTIQTTIQHVTHLPVVDVDDATAANCVQFEFRPSTTNNNKKKNYTPTRTTSPSITGPTTRHPQPHAKIAAVVIIVTFFLSNS